MLGLFTVMWCSMLILDRIAQAQGYSSGLRPYIVLVGLGLVVLVLILLFDARTELPDRSSAAHGRNEVGTSA